MTCPKLTRARALESFDPRHLDPMALTSAELVELACMLARVGSVICDLGGKAAPGATADVDQPYIWDLPED